MSIDRIITDEEWAQFCTTGYTGPFRIRCLQNMVLQPNLLENPNVWVYLRRMAEANQTTTLFPNVAENTGLIQVGGKGVKSDQWKLLSLPPPP